MYSKENVEKCFTPVSQMGKERETERDRQTDRGKETETRWNTWLSIVSQIENCAVKLCYIDLLKGKRERHRDTERPWDRLIEAKRLRQRGTHSFQL